MSTALLGLLRGLVLAVALLAPLGAAAAPEPQPQTAPNPKYQPGQIIVRFREDASALDKARILAAYPVLRNIGGLYRLSVPPGAEASAAKTLSADPAIASAIPNEKLFFPIRPAQARAAAYARDAAQPALHLAVPVDAPHDAPAQVTPTPTPAPGSSPAITRFVLSDSRTGGPPAGEPNDMGKCGYRFNANQPIWSSISYQNLPGQTVQVQVYYLGFKDREYNTNSGWGEPLGGTGSATKPLPLWQSKPLVGCYEARLWTGADSNITLPNPPSIRFQIVTAPLQDELFPRNLWQLDHTRAYIGGNPVADVKATGAWNITTGSDITIAVISSGVNLSHPEFSQRLTAGRDLFRDSPDASDDYGVGTFLAGLIAANARNGVDCLQCQVVGVNWGAKIMPLKASAVTARPDGGFDFASDAATMVESINYAWVNGAKIILLTYPIDPNTTELATQQQLANEINQATDRGALVIAPVGEDWDGTRPNVRNLPADLPGSRVLSVTATDEQDRHWPLAYTGDYVDIAAPGRRDLYSTNIPRSYWNSPSVTDPDYADGDTSFAAAQIAGIAGLVWSVNPTLRPADVRRQLLDTADKVDTANSSYDETGRNDFLGFGRVNAERALWETPHHLPDAFRPIHLVVDRAGRYCRWLENKQTAAITWTARVATADSSWVSLTRNPVTDATEIFSGRGSPSNRDFQGDLPSRTEVCFTLDSLSIQSSERLLQPRIFVTSNMPSATVRELSLGMRVWVNPYKVLLPLLFQAPSEYYR